MHESNRRSGSLTKLFKSYLISYASVLLLPIVICSLYYYHSYNTLKDHANQAQYLAQENLGEQLNAILTDSVNIGSHIKLNKYVSALAQGKSTWNSSPILDRRALQRDLSSLQVSNSMIEELNIYFSSDHYVVNSSTAYERSLLSAMEPNSSRVSLSDWDTIEKGLKSSTFYCYSDMDKKTVLMAQALFFDISGTPEAILCIQLDKQKIIERLQQGELSLEYPCDFALINQDQVLLSTQEVDLAAQNIPIDKINTYFALSPEHALYEFDAGQTWITGYVPLQFSPLALISVASKQDYASGMTKLLELMFFTIIICMLAGTCVIMYYSHKNYEPVSDIIQYIQHHDTTHASMQNEYHLIMQTLMENHSQLQKQHDLLKNNYLQKILNGEIALAAVPDQIVAQFSLELSCENFCIAVLSVEQMGCFSSYENAADITAFSVKNVYQEMLEEHFSHTEFVQQNHLMTVLIPLSSDTLFEGMHLTEMITQNLFTFLYDSFQIQLHAGISSADTQDQIPTAYLQAKNALEYQQLFDEKSICTYQSLPKVKNIGAVSLNSVDYVLNLVIENHQTQLVEYFQALTQELQEYELSWTDAKSFFYFFYQITSKLQLYCKAQYNLTIEALDDLDRSYFIQSLSKALSETQNAYLQASDELAKLRAAKDQNTWGHDICQFIDNNYFNSNINLNTIAEQFKISPSYLSKKFREHYGKTIIDYLYEVRITNAVSLLTDTDLKVADIAQMTGFIDSNAFIRIFKKLKGTTPGRFKETL